MPTSPDAAFFRHMRGRASKRGTLYIRGLSMSVKDHFKALCARRGVSMTIRIEELIREDIQKDNVLKEQSGGP